MRHYSTLIIGVVSLALVFSAINACSLPTTTGTVPIVTAESCILIDTDVTADDLRAIAILSASRQVRAIVTTGGGTRSGVGAAIVRRLFVEAGHDPPPILVGSDDAISSQSASDHAFRDYEEHQFGAIPAPLAPTAGLPRAAASAVSGCSDVVLVLLAPWMDVAALLSVPNLRAVFAQGRPDLRPDGKPVNWNCQQASEACAKAQHLLAGHQLAWIDISPRPASHWSLTQQMVDPLPNRGFPGAVRALAANDDARIGWRGLWDDLVALAVLRPDLFRSAGTHFEPAADNAAIVTAWTAALER